MSNPFTADLNQNPETGQIVGEQNQMQNAQLYGYVPPTSAYSYDVLNAPGYVPYPEGHQIQSHNVNCTINGHCPTAVQNNQTMMNPYSYAPYPVFHNPYAPTSIVQNQIYQPQVNQDDLYNIPLLEPIQLDLTPYVPPPGADLLNPMKFYVPLAAELFEPPKYQISNSEKREKPPQEVGAALHPKTSPLHNGSSSKQKSTTTSPKQEKKYHCSSCKTITKKIMLKKKGPKNWLCG